jgi:hypothetical protein
MIPQGPLKHGPTISNLAGNEGFCQFARQVLIVGTSILLTAQKNITGHWALHPCEKTPMLIQKTYTDAVFSAKPHQKRAA